MYTTTENFSSSVWLVEDCGPCLWLVWAKIWPFSRQILTGKNWSFFKAIFDNLRIHALVNLPKIAKIWPFSRQILAGKNWSFFKAIFDDCICSDAHIISLNKVVSTESLSKCIQCFDDFFNIFKTNVCFSVSFLRLDINTGKIMDSIKFEAGNLCMVTGGRNTGRVGTIMHRERHPGSFDIVHVKVKLMG